MSRSFYSHKCSWNVVKISAQAEITALLNPDQHIIPKGEFGIAVCLVFI